MTAIRWICQGCGFEVPTDVELPFACPYVGQGDVEHILTRNVAPEVLAAPKDPAENPYVAYRERFTATHFGRAHGLSDDALVGLIEDLDEEIYDVDGHRFTTTPFLGAAKLAQGLGLDVDLRIKVECVGVSGSHKGRHIMGMMHSLRVLEATGRSPWSVSERPRLAVMSCGNAAIAAATVARAVQWPLDVFVPADAPPGVLERLRLLKANVEICERDGQPGDPCYRAFRAALRAGALPFGCQGPDNALAVEGGLTLGYELVEQLREGPGELDTLIIAVGGGCLASSCITALEEAVAAGQLGRMPRVCLVQTEAAHPLKRAYDLARADLEAGGDGVDAVMAQAAQTRSRYMRPWPTAPQSIARAILDDETHDWWVAVGGMLRTGGFPVLVDEATLARAHQAARQDTGIPADETGTAGLAGLIAMHESGQVRPGGAVAVLFTGRQW